MQRNSGWLAATAGEDCMGHGWLARRACPVGREYTHDAAQAHFHMRAFRVALSEGN